MLTPRQSPRRHADLPAFPMIPLSDENPALRAPVMTWLLLGAMFATWVMVQGGGFDDAKLVSSVCQFGMIPGELTRSVPLGSVLHLAPGLGCAIRETPASPFTPLLSMFLHGGWLHLLGNALFFWVFGHAIEDSMGPWRFLAFYLLCGLVAAGAQVAAEPASPVPTVGASGAISGVMGAYLILYPRVRVHMLFIFVIFFRVFRVPAWAVLLWWFALQVLAALPSLSSDESGLSGGVAVWAHVGGFVAGMLLVRLFVDPRFVAQRRRLIQVTVP
jgi:membrane associated rhomboid family serine protease